MTATQEATIDDTLGTIASLRHERDAAQSRGAALVEVLEVINRSPGDPAPVFEKILEKAHSLCGATLGSLVRYDGERFRGLTTLGYPQPFAERICQPFRPSIFHKALIRGERLVHLPDVRNIQLGPDQEIVRSLVELTQVRTFLLVPLRKDGALLGLISAMRQEVRPFSDTEITLLENFAAQAVMAMENARLLAELRERTAELAQRNNEYGERIAHQAASIDVLKAMSASPGDPQPVFDQIVWRARELCNSAAVILFEYDGRLVHFRAPSGYAIDQALQAEYQSRFPAPPTRDSITCRAILDRAIMHVRDLDEEPDLLPMVRRFGHKSQLSVPLLRDGAAIGVITLASIGRGGFSDSQVALLQTFAEQAVIAIGSAETFRALQNRTSDLQESLEYQTATSDVLKVISRSTFDLQPVLDTVAQAAARLCDADQAVIVRREGEVWRFAVNFGFPPEYEAYLKALGPMKLDPSSPTVVQRTAREGRPVRIDDVAAVSGYPEALIGLGKQRTSLGVPLLRGGETIGLIQLSRQRVEPFTDRQIELVSTFADQAVIAIENTRLLTEQKEALEQQTATTEVLQVINASHGNLVPVFESVIEKSIRLCEAPIGALYTYDGKRMNIVAARGMPPLFVEFRMQHPPAIYPGDRGTRALETRRSLHILDVLADVSYLNGDAGERTAIELSGARTMLLVPLLKPDAVLGIIVVYRREVRAFSDQQIALLENFATQAVIAMENARLVHELRMRTDELAQREAELRVTFENMADGVAMFDEMQHLIAWNRKFQDILDVPDEIIARRLTFPEYVRYLAERGEFGAGADPDEQVRRVTEQVGQHRTYERTRPDGRIIEIRSNPVPGGGFVLIYADVTERKRSEAEIRAARDAAEEASRTIEAAFRELKAAQANLIQAEKMASLGQLTAGVAHEIKNPLNFVNNFAALSVDLLGELKEAAAPGFAALTDDRRAEIEAVTAMLTGNLAKITEHGRRADGIVKAMLEHSRGASGERRTVDINTLADEALTLAYHGARAQDQGFNITLQRDLGEAIAPIEVNPQDITRVLLNLFSNGFYAASKRARGGSDRVFAPTLTVATRAVADAVEIRVRDNGTGISPDIRDKLFEPFFTTKPTGEGTGLGLSITYDIVTKSHGGTIKVNSAVDDFTEFVVTLPRMGFANATDRR